MAWAFSSSPDWPGATAALARLPAPPGDNCYRNWCAANGVDWPPYWPGDKLGPSRKVGDARFGNPGRRISCNNDICADSVCLSLRPESEEKNQKIKSEERTGRTSKTKKEEELSDRIAEEDPNRRKRNFKPPGFLHFHSAADTWLPIRKISASVCGRRAGKWSRAGEELERKEGSGQETEPTRPRRPWGHPTGLLLRRRRLASGHRRSWASRWRLLKAGAQRTCLCPKPASRP